MGQERYKATTSLVCVYITTHLLHVICTFLIGCPAYVSINHSKVKDAWFVCSKSIFDHRNHQVSQEEYAKYPENCRLDEKELEELQDLFQTSSIRPSLAAQHLQKTTNKFVTPRRILNLKLKNNPVNEKADLMDFLQKFGDEGGVVERRLNDSNVTTCLFMMSKSMMNRLNRQKPECILLDTTFKTRCFPRKKPGRTENHHLKSCSCCKTAT